MFLQLIPEFCHSREGGTMREVGPRLDSGSYCVILTSVPADSLLLTSCKITLIFKPWDNNPVDCRCLADPEAAASLSGWTGRHGAVHSQQQQFHRADRGPGRPDPAAGTGGGAGRADGAGAEWQSRLCSSVSEPARCIAILSACTFPCLGSPHQCPVIRLDFKSQ